MICGSYRGKCPPQGRYLFWTHCNSHRTRITPKTLCLHFSLLCQDITPPLLAAGDLEGAWHYITRTLKCAYFSQICTTTKILIILEMLKKWHEYKRNDTIINKTIPIFTFIFHFVTFLFFKFIVSVSWPRRYHSFILARRHLGLIHTRICPCALYNAVSLATAATVSSRATENCWSGVAVISPLDSG